MEPVNLQVFLNATYINQNSFVINSFCWIDCIKKWLIISYDIYVQALLVFQSKQFSYNSSDKETLRLAWHASLKGGYLSFVNISDAFEIQYYFLWLHLFTALFAACGSLTVPLFVAVLAWRALKATSGLFWLATLLCCPASTLNWWLSSSVSLSNLFLPFWMVIGHISLVYELCRTWISVGSCPIWRPKYVNTMLSY